MSGTSCDPPEADLARLRRENEELSRLCADLGRYLRQKIDQLLVMMGSKPMDTLGIDDGTLLSLDPIGTLSDAFGEIRRHLHAMNDTLRSEIAERLRSEATLREQEEKFRTLAEFSTSWVFWRGADGRMIFVSPAVEQITGFPAAEFYADPGLAERVIHPDDRALWKEHCHLADSLGGPGPIEFRVVAKGGTDRWMSHVCRPVYAESGEFLGIRGSNRDVTDRKKTEDALRRNEEFLRDFIDNATDLIQSVGPDGRFLHVNRAWRDKLGYGADEVAALTILDIVDPDSRPHCEAVFARVLAGEDVGEVETVFRAKDGTKVLVEGHVNCRFENGRPAATRSIFRDVTERRKIEEHLLKARKLESVGVLAGGIAHDFNNYLTAILGNVSLCRVLAEPDTELAKRLADAETASVRAKELTRQLLTFSKGGAPIREAAGIEEIVRDAALFAARGSNVQCVFDFGEGCVPVTVDREQIGQAIANLVINAVQAMPRGGAVTVRSRDVVSEGGDVPGLRNGRFVRLSIEDRGVGIPKDHLPLIFDPFFTTKSKGSGLGLTTAFSIVKSHNGLIAVESEPGSGTTVHVYLPAADARPAVEGERAPRRGTGRILVMDDEEMVRDVAIGMLRNLGYSAEAARNGAEALDAWQRALDAGEPFDAAIMDLTVPGGMGGKEAVRRLLAADPSARAIVSSGYSDDPVMSHHAEHGFRGVIAKPYTMSELQRVLGNVLFAQAS